MNNKQNSNWLVDFTLFAGFLLAFFLDLTGLELHQWLGVAVGGVAAYHLVTHWKWVSTVTDRFFKKTSARARLYYLIDAAIFSGFFIISLTGLVISTWLNLSLTDYAVWLHVHIQASIMTLVLTVVKVGMHWRWVVATAKKIFKRPGQQAQRESPVIGAVLAAAPVRTRQQYSRGDFIKLMGIVGVASVVALGRAASELRETIPVKAGTEEDDSQPLASQPETSQQQADLLQTDQSQASLTQIDPPQTSLPQANMSNSPESYRSESNSSESYGSDSSSSNQSCMVQCRYSCYYPGGCRRYIDNNNNNLCDHGECV